MRGNIYSLSHIFFVVARNTPNKIIFNKRQQMWHSKSLQNFVLVSIEIESLIRMEVSAVDCRKYLPGGIHPVNSCHRETPAPRRPLRIRAIQRPWDHRMWVVVAVAVAVDHTRHGAWHVKFHRYELGLFHPIGTPKCLKGVALAQVDPIVFVCTIPPWGPVMQLPVRLDPSKGRGLTP
jgi:hypothetical protein